MAAAPTEPPAPPPPRRQTRRRGCRRGACPAGMPVHRPSRCQGILPPTRPDSGASLAARATAAVCGRGAPSVARGGGEAACRRSRRPSRPPRRMEVQPALAGSAPRGCPGSPPPCAPMRAALVQRATCANRPRARHHMRPRTHPRCRLRRCSPPRSGQGRPGQPTLPTEQSYCRAPHSRRRHSRCRSLSGGRRYRRRSTSHPRPTASCPRLLPTSLAPSARARGVLSRGAQLSPARDRSSAA